MSIKVFQIETGGFDHNFSYVISAEDGSTAVVDPCGDISKIQAVLGKLENCIPRYIMLTHGHRDHIDGLEALKQFFPARVAASEHLKPHPDIPLKDGNRLPFADTFIDVIYTPGHTSDSVCYRIGDLALFTGDTLFVGDCGYSNPETMFRTMREKIFPLPDSLTVYPGHNYGDQPHDTLGNQKKHNICLIPKDIESFKEALKNL